MGHLHTTQRRGKKFTTYRRTYFRATVSDSQFPRHVAPPCGLTPALQPLPAPVDTLRRQGRAGPLYRTYFRDKCATRKRWRDQVPRDLAWVNSWMPQSPWKTARVRGQVCQKAPRPLPSHRVRASRRDEPPRRARRTLKQPLHCERKFGAVLRLDIRRRGRQKLRMEKQQHGRFLAAGLRHWLMQPPRI